MGLRARSALSRTVNSYEAGRQIAGEIREGLGGPLALGIVYATVNHDQAALLAGIQAALGAATPLVGCSCQGVMVRGATAENGFLLGMAGLGGDALAATVAHVEQIQHDTEAKGAALGRELLRGGARPKVVLLYFDALCGASLDLLLAGLSREVGCPIVGGGAGQPFGRMVRTFQYRSGQVLSDGAVAAALSGDFAIASEICHGTTPVGLEMTATGVDGNHLLELDGRSALEVWSDLAGGIPPYNDFTSALALGLPYTDAAGQRQYRVRAAFGQDVERRGVVLHSAVPAGSRVMLHHRTVEGVLEGTRQMAERLRGQVDPGRVKAVLGFECGARVEPFLGREQTLQENLRLQEALAPDAAWLGMFAHGEVHPVGGEQAVHNYSFPVLALSDLAGR